MLCLQISLLAGLDSAETPHCASVRVLYGQAGVELGSEMAKGSAWPTPPQPCGIIAGTQSLALTNPTSWLTSLFHMIPGEKR